jgi:hypothetical protein
MQPRRTQYGKVRYFQQDQLTNQPLMMLVGTWATSLSFAHIPAEATF